MNNEKKTAFAIGRWMPIHLGHKQFLVKLARTFDHLVIGIGSCYENGTPRNCIPAVEREKLLCRMLKAEGITNVTILPVEDRPTFEAWIDDVCEICRRYRVTHFCTGNKEDILDVMARLGIHLDVEMINPEDGSDFPYHATDIRNAILNGEYDRLDTMIPAEIKPMVLDQISREIRAANRGEGQEFIPGRQTVDLVFTVKSAVGGVTYALIGKRNEEKIDFPGIWAIPGGGIKEFESPVHAALRCFYAETGIHIELLDNACEPARVVLRNLSNIEADLHFTGIYASPDERINGTRGGGSQCFAISIEGALQDIVSVLHSTHDLDVLRFVPVDEIHGLTLAYDQKRMLTEALCHMGIPYDNGERLAVFEGGLPTGEGVSRARAHAEGIPHGASHVYVRKYENDVLYFLLQRRSAGKDSFPLCLDTSSAGHIEQGSTHLETARKELFEELGYTAAEDDLIELFSQTVDQTSDFHGKKFIDREYNRIYLLFSVPNENELHLQREEVAEVVWLPVDEILARLDADDPELCLDKEEFRRVAKIVRDGRL
ncbi:MAG: NUDIX domain-containing protein [Clostridia bacterium]|nr:NUDIX domain-containing protein [Clostridia bacterium]